MQGKEPTTRIIIKSEAYVTDKGKYETNEDTLTYISGKIYMVCDGVGGNGNGLLASKLLATSIKNAFTKSDSKDIIVAFQEAEIVLEKHKKKHPETKQMSSTLALAQIFANSILITWVGDSRVYQFRSGKIVFKTTDHSVVGEVLKKGEITEVEALFHTDANILTRSIKGSSQPANVEQRLLTDIKENDYFLLCSDGLLEAWIDSDLEELFSKVKPTSYFIQKLNANCKLFSNDNYTALIFQVGII
jgi:protein phosphatase